MASPRLGEFLSSSLLQHLPELIDSDTITDENLYFVPPSQQLAVGKYVPDEIVAKKEVVADDSDDDASFREPLTASLQDLDELRSVHFTVPSLKDSSSPLFFPIHYTPTTHKDKADPRGLPVAINQQFYGVTDRPQLRRVTASVKSNNLLKIPLYKVGPGAVAFRVVLNAMEASGMRYTPDTKLCNLLWAKRATPDVLAVLSAYQKVNHFPGTWGVGRKDSLHKNVLKMRKQFGEEFEIVPQTWLVPADLPHVQEHSERHAVEGVPPTYIVKPSASSCGKGIYLCQGVPVMAPNAKQMICQHYIANPMIVHGRKFDLRMYCVVTGFDPLRIYLFDEGLVRFAAEKYPGADKLLENANAHLTNYSINKATALAKQSKGKAEDSDDAIDIKWAISDLKRYLRETHGNAEGERIWQEIYSKAKDVVVKMFLSIENEVVSKIRSECVSDPTGSRCFELYGLDLMVDASYNVTLIEANIMPSLATGSTLDKAVKARMIAHMLTLVGVFADDRSTSKASSETYPSWLSNVRYFYPSKTGSPTAPPDDTNARTSIPQFSVANDPSNPDSILTAGEQRMLYMAEEEFARAGGFDRIFPSNDSLIKYGPLFSRGVLRSNYVLMSSVSGGAQHTPDENL